MNCNNISSKFIYRKKNRIHWSRSLSHRIALSLRINYRKMSSMWLPSLVYMKETRFNFPVCYGTLKIAIMHYNLLLYVCRHHMIQFVSIA